MSKSLVPDLHWRPSCPQCYLFKFYNFYKRYECATSFLCRLTFPFFITSFTPGVVSDTFCYRKPFLTIDWQSPSLRHGVHLPRSSFISSSDALNSIHPIPSAYIVHPSAMDIDTGVCSFSYHVDGCSSVHHYWELRWHLECNSGGIEGRLFICSRFNFLSSIYLSIFANVFFQGQFFDRCPGYKRNTFLWRFLCSSPENVSWVLRLPHIPLLVLCRSFPSQVLTLLSIVSVWACLEIHCPSEFLLRRSSPSSFSSSSFLICLSILPTSCLLFSPSTQTITPDTDKTSRKHIICI